MSHFVLSLFAHCLFFFRYLGKAVLVGFFLSWSFHLCSNIGIKHVFSCNNIRQVPKYVLKTEAGGRDFQHLPRDLVNVNAWKNHVSIIA